MSRRTFIAVVLSMVVSGAIFHALAVSYFWYWIWKPLDNFVHFYFGAAVAVASFGVSWQILHDWLHWNVFRPVLWIYRKVGCSSLHFAMISVLVVGVLWEWCEPVRGHGFSLEKMLLLTNSDTRQDILMDLFGGLFAWVIMYAKGSRHRTAAASPKNPVS